MRRWPPRIFHYGTYTVNQLKEELDKRGIPVRVTA